MALTSGGGHGRKQINLGQKRIFEVSLVRVCKSTTVSLYLQSFTEIFSKQGFKGVVGEGSWSLSSQSGGRRITTV